MLFPTSQKTEMKVQICPVNALHYYRKTWAFAKGIIKKY